jgi:MFS family permease
MTPAIQTSNLSRWYVVGLLMTVSVLAYLDRLVMSLLIQPIKVDLDLSDTQAAILSAGAFAAFYILMGIPLGRMVDRNHRSRLLAACLSLWSIMCGACGFAQNFVTLFLARAGVGVGEAALNPAAISIISDYFKPSEVARPLSYFSLGVYAGGGLALLLGGQLIAWALTLPPIILIDSFELSGWRLVFIAAGLPGILVAPLLWCTVRERSDLDKGSNALPEAAPADRLWPYIRANGKTFGIIGAGLVAFGFNVYSVLTWYPAMMQRSFGWSPQDIAASYGWVYLIGGTGGGLLAPVILSWGYRLGVKAAPVTLCAISCALMALSSITAPLMPTIQLCLLVSVITLFSWAVTLGTSFVVLTTATPNTLRGSMTGLYMVIMNGTGGILGPLLVGWMTDSWLGSEKLDLALALLALASMPLASICLMAGRGGYTQLVEQAIATSDERNVAEPTF